MPAVSLRPLLIPWRFVLLSSYVIVNVGLTLTMVSLGPEAGQDWQVFSALRPDTMYITVDDVPFIWSPVAGWLMIGAVQFGYWVWLVLHVAVVFLLRSPLLIGLVLVSYGFWFDTAQGNTLTFSLIAGMLALRGSQAASLAYLALFVLIPRPLLLPLAVWIFWKQPAARWPFVAMLFVHAAAVFASGHAAPWIEVMLEYSGPAGVFDWAAILGPWWLPIGLPISAWLTSRGRVGWAGMVVSPYLLPQYLIWPLIELGRQRHEAQSLTVPTHDPESSPAIGVETMSAGS